MAYIVPSSSIEYFGDVNLSPECHDTMYFSDTQSKDNAFGQLAKLGSESAVSYAFKDRPVFRSALSIATLAGCRYIRFKNADFENKWFYAFVISVDYANNGLTEITFMLDEYMTWLGSFTLGSCLVVREHTATDNAYEHLIDEGLPTGDYVLSGREEVAINSDPVLVMSVARNSSTVGAVGHYKGNLLSGAEYRKYNISPSGLSDLETDIDALIQQTQKDAIISAQIVPGIMAPQDATAALQPLPVINNFTGSIKSSALAFGSYSPRNKKLFSYPYCVMSVFNSEGSEQEFRYEFFTNNVAHFYVFGIASDVPELAIIPTQYKNGGISYIEDQMMTMRQWPQASLSIDQYKAWVAQMNSGGGWISVIGSVAKDVATMAGGVAMGALSAASGNPFGVVAAGGAIASGARSMGETVTELLADKKRYEAMPDAVQGTANSFILMGINNKKFIIYHRQITAEYAKEIDEFFDMYGYRVNRVKVPSLDNRPHWTYVETRGAIVKGSIPASAARTIEGILNRGCRFWKSFSEIGDMSLNNRPT